jgi:NAD(P)H-dependent flavin oxidoreductase YrpB (nitropropane dioxygenase family)
MTDFIDVGPVRTKRPDEDAVDWMFSTGQMSESLYNILRPQNRPSRPSPAPAAVSAPRSAHTQRTPSRSGTEARYIRNPLVDNVLETSRTMYQNALNVSEPPTLFNGGDLPAETRSGLDPQKLLDVPWQARHAVASARTQAEAAELIEVASGPDADDKIRMFELDRHEGNKAYQARVNAWVTDGVKGEAARQEDAKYTEVIASTNGPTMTVDQQVEAMLAAGEQAVQDRKSADDQKLRNGTWVGHGRGWGLPS